MDGRFDNKAELVGLIMDNLRINPEEAIMVGDRKEDIVAGKKNCIRTIGVTYGFGSEEEIKQSDPTYICRNPVEVQTAILSVV
jgi:phosphoglycolate phosphatase